MVVSLFSHFRMANHNFLIDAMNNTLRKFDFVTEILSQSIDTPKAPRQRTIQQKLYQFEEKVIDPIDILMINMSVGLKIASGKEEKPFLFELLIVEYLHMITGLFATAKNAGKTVTRNKHNSNLCAKIYCCD